MEPTPVADSAPATPAPAAGLSFTEAMRAASQPAPESAAATEPTTPAATPPAEPTPVPAADPHAYLRDLPGDFKTPDELRQALSGLDELRANQLTADQRALLKLSEDPAAWREFHQLTHEGDLKDLSDEDILFRAFLRERPDADPDDARFLFEQEQDSKYPGLAEAPEDRAHKAHLGERRRAAERERTAMSQAREARLAELQKGALPAQGPSPEEQDQQRAAFLDTLKQTVSQHPDGYQLKLDVDGQPLNLTVAASDLPALETLMGDPLGALLKDGSQTTLDPQKLLRFAAFHTQGDALLAAAYRAGRTGQGPVVTLDELHNGQGGVAANPAAGGDGSFASLLKQATGPAAARPRY